MDDFMSKVTTSATMLLTGFTVVFSVLILLILIIYIYGTVISKAQKKSKEGKKKKSKANQTEAQSTTVQNTPSIPTANVAQSNEIPGEIVAVIAAAVDSMYGSNTKVRIKNIKKSGTRSTWANAGILDNTRPF